MNNDNERFDIVKDLFKRVLKDYFNPVGNFKFIVDHFRNKGADKSKNNGQQKNGDQPRP